MHFTVPPNFTHPPDLSPDEAAIRDLSTLSLRLSFQTRATTLFQKQLTNLHSHHPHIQASKTYQKLKSGARALNLSQRIQRIQLHFARRRIERRIAESEQRKKEEEYRKRVLADNARARRRLEEALRGGRVWAHSRDGAGLEDRLPDIPWQINAQDEDEDEEIVVVNGEESGSDGSITLVGDEEGDEEREEIEEMDLPRMIDPDREWWI